MSPRCVSLPSSTMHTCTILCLTRVELMAPFWCIRSMAPLLIFSLQKVPANTGYARRLQSWGESLAFILYTRCVILLISVGGRYFLFLILDKAVCPFLVKYFEMPIWHRWCNSVLKSVRDLRLSQFVQWILYLESDFKSQRQLQRKENTWKWVSGQF